MFTAALLVFRFGYITSVLRGRIMFPHINFSADVDECDSPESVAFSNSGLVEGRALSRPFMENLV